MMSVTVPAVPLDEAPGKPPAPPVPRPEAAPPGRVNDPPNGDDALDEDDELRCMYAPAQMPPNASNKTSNPATGHGRRRPLAGPCVGHSSGSPSHNALSSFEPSSAPPESTAGTCAVSSMRCSPVGWSS